jgi:Transposase DDE domain
MVERINSIPDFSESFGDSRIGLRAAQMVSKLVTGRNVSVHRISESQAQRKAFYRLLENKNFSEEGIEQSIVKRCGALCKGRHVLCIQDTTEMNLESHRGRLKIDSGVGRTTKEGILGFFLHPCFVVDADKGTALGYSYIDVWHRDEKGADRHQREYKKQHIDLKESGKWLKAAKQSEEELSGAEQITIVADRESDIFDMFGRYGATKVKLLIRSNSNRRINAGTDKLVGYLAGQPVRACHTITVNGDIRKGIAKRKVALEIKWATVELCKPGSCKDTSLPAKIQVTVVEAMEKGKANGVCWRLYTTHEVTSISDALQMIEWYKQRWYIEQVFRLLKMQGMQIEGSQLESGWAIRKLTMLALLAVLRIMQMLIAYEDDNEQPVEEVFTEDELHCLAQTGKKLEGETEKLSNPHQVLTLKWATWIIARLGGWKGYASQRKPGPIILHRGFIKFYQLYEGWTMAKKFFEDVGTQ